MSRQKVHQLTMQAKSLQGEIDSLTSLLESADEAGVNIELVNDKLEDATHRLVEVETELLDEQAR